jgi:hypothetical protein
MAETGNTLELPPELIADDESFELARIWITNGGPATIAIDAAMEPFAFGMLMVDTIRHAGRAYAAQHGVAEEDALREIWEGLDAKRGQPTTDLETVQQPGSVN